MNNYYARFLEVRREDGTLVRVNTDFVEAVTESKVKGTSETRGTIVIRANTFRVADLSYEQVWAAFVEASGKNIQVIPGTHPHLLSRDIEPGI